MSSPKDDAEIGTQIRQIIGSMLQLPDQLGGMVAVHPLDVMTPDGIRRAFIMVTMNETIVQHLEAGIRAAMEQLKRELGGDL